MTRYAALFFANSFMLLNWILGVDRTVKVIRRLANRCQSKEIALDIVSDNLQHCYSKYRYVVIANKQKCLWRGYVLYFYAKRANIPIKFIFGAKIDQPSAEKTIDDLQATSPKQRNQQDQTAQALNWHCWIEQDEKVCFEVPEIVAQYTPFIHYR